MKRRTKKWTRILFNTLTAMSLLLAIMTVGLWIWSAVVGGGVSRRSTDYASSGKLAFLEQQIYCEDGYIFYKSSVVSVNVLPSELRPTVPEKAVWERESPAHNPEFVHRIFPQFVIPRFAWKVPETEIAALAFIPLWEIFLLASILPTARLPAWIRSLCSPRPGHCPACGYDIRANPAKCSECGRDIVVASD